MVFQDPIASLNARMRVGAIVSEPLAIHEPRLARREREARAQQMLHAVGLGSALDVSVGAQILELLDSLRRDFSLTLILISHSLPVIAQLATRVAVMQGGRFVEFGSADQVLQSPRHPYTQALTQAVPQVRS